MRSGQDCPCFSGDYAVAGRYSRREREALAATGLTGETAAGQLVLAAVLLPRRSCLRFAGMRRRGWVDFEVPTLLCPWAPPGRRCLIKHGPAYRSDEGSVCELQFYGNGLIHKSSHCGNRGAPRGYFLRLIVMPDRPRRVITPDGGPA